MPSSHRPDQRAAGHQEPRPRRCRALLVDTVASGDHERLRLRGGLRPPPSGRPGPPPSAPAAHPSTPSGRPAIVDLRWLLRLPPPARSTGHFDIVHFHLPYTAALGRLVVATLPRRRRPVTIYTEHSLWNKVAVLVKALNRATVRLDRALIAVSQAAYDALPGALRPRAQVVVHGVDLSRSSDMLGRHRATRSGARCGTSSGIPAGGRAGGDRGQPPVGEGLRRPARRGPAAGRSAAFPSGSPPPARGSQRDELDRPAPPSSAWATGSASSATARTPSGC